MSSITKQRNIQPVTQRFKLKESTVHELQKLTPEFGFNGLGEVVFRRTYSRNNESWADVVVRVVQGAMSIRKEHFYRNTLRWDDDEWQQFATDMAFSLFKMEWMPPGRGLWMMGTDFAYERGSMALNNCFRSDTKFWTDEGLRSFSEFKDGDKTTVRGKNNWLPATVHNFGKQRLWKLTMGKGSARRDVYTTPNHRWLAKKGDGKYNWKIKTTENLENGWKLQNFAKRTNFSVLQVCPVGVQHGIVYGDGTRHLETNNCKIQLCGDKVELSRHFFTPRKSNKTINGLPNTWKNLPSLTMNKEYLFGFLAGWFATDGSVSKTSNLSLTNSDKKVLEWARNAFFKLDILTGPIGISRPYDGSEKPSYCVHIYRDVIPDTFFLNDKHMSRFKTSSNYVEWKIVSIEPTETIEDVWCVSEPQHEEFTLEDGVLTKNCGAVDTKDDIVLAADWTMDGLMNGVGIGFTTNWRGEAKMPDKKDTEIFVIPDSREGWIESLIKLMCSYINSPRHGKNKFPTFDYTLIRPPGSPIRGFGGTASGFGPLKKLHDRVTTFLDAICIGRLQANAKTWKEFKTSDGKSEWKEVEITVDRKYSHTRFVADVFNSIGACVVAGNVRRCLPGDAMVHTKKGLVPLKNVKAGDHVLTMEGYEKVVKHFEQGEQKLVKIITQDGEFRCTPNHKMAVCTTYDTYEWKQASELKTGDRLISSRQQVEGEDTKLPAWKYEKSPGSTTCKDIIIPDLDEDMAWLIGLFQGDGYTYANHIKNGFNAYISIVGGMNEYDAMEKAQTQLQRFGKDLHVTLKKRKNENSYIVHCQSKQLALYFDKHVKQPNTTIRTPEFILRATQSVKLAYVAGVTDADGCLKNRPIQVLTTVYNEFARDIQNVLYSCGIESRYNTCTTDWKSREGWQPLFQVNLITKKSQRDFDDIPQLNKEMRKTSRSQNANGFPTTFEKVPKTKTKFGLYSNKQFNIDAYDRHYNECDYCPVEVVEIINDKVEQTYDIEVENRHEFFCNGLLTHNSAEICLGDVEDDDFLNLKNYDMYPERSELGWMSNNSVVLRADQNYEDFSYIPELARRIRDNGEPGIINLYNIQKYSRIGKESHDDATMVNPCFSGDTMIALADGRGCMRIDQLVKEGKDVPVYSMDEVSGEVSIQWGRNPRVTGTGQKLLRIHFDGKNKDEYMDVTSNHKFFLNDGRNVKACELKKGDSMPQFKKAPNGKDDYVVIHTNGKRKVEHRMIKEFHEPTELCKTYTEGAHNGCCRTHNVVHHKDDNNHPDNLKKYYDQAEQNSNGLFLIRVSDTELKVIKPCENEKCSLEFVVHWGEREKSYCSISCANTKKESIEARKKGQKQTFEAKGKAAFHKQAMIYKNLCEEMDLVEKKDFERACKEHKVSCRFNAKSTNPWIADGWRHFKQMVEDHNHRVSWVEELGGEHEVYNITVENNHTLAVVTKMNHDFSSLSGVFTFNCGEIPLSSGELCNLAETFPPRCANAERFYQALKFAAFYTSAVSLLPTHRPETNAIVSKNRRVGVSISGIAQWASGVVPDGWGHMDYTKMGIFLRKGYKIVREENSRLADAAGVPHSIRVTTVKPSGSISLLAGVTPGVHYPVSRWAIRRMRIGNDSPLVPALKAAGVPWEVDMASDNTLVFEFTIDHGNVRQCEDVSPWEQFSLVQMLQKHYSDNCVSATVFFDKEKDGSDIEKMLAMFIPNLKSVSMLPHSGHGYKQAPYEPLTKEQHDERRNAYKLPDFRKVEGNVPKGSKFCSGDRCEL